MKKLLKNKKSLVALLLVCVLALSACGNAGGNNTENSQNKENSQKPEDSQKPDNSENAGGQEVQALDITSTIKVNGDNAPFTLEEKDGAYVVTATANKGEWDYVYFEINQDAKAYDTVELVVEAKDGTKFLKKLEGGDATVVEEESVANGSEQTITWKVSADNFTATGGQKFLIFLNHGTAGAPGNESLTIKSVKLTKSAASSSKTYGLDITDSIAINDGYTMKEVNDGYKVTANSDKGEWSFFYFMIKENVKERTTIEIVLEGSKGTKYLKKLEGGGAEVLEEEGTLSGKEDVVRWTVDPKHLTDGSDENGEKLLIFLNHTVAGAPGNEWVTIKSVRLLSEADIKAEEEANKQPEEPEQKPEDTQKPEEEQKPEEPKYEDASTDLMNLMASNDEGAYDVVVKDGVPTITTTATKGAWSAVVAPVPNDGLIAKELKVVFKGTAGKEIIIKAEMSGGSEKRVTLTGEEQVETITIPASDVAEASDAKVVIFVDPESAEDGTYAGGTVVEITEIALYGQKLITATGDATPVVMWSLFLCAGLAMVVVARKMKSVNF